MTHPSGKKDVLITGASGVIGSAITRRLAKQGYLPHITARTLPNLAPLQKQLSAEKIEPVLYALDLSDLQRCREVVEEFFSQASAPFALVCNAGNHGPLGLFAETTFEDWRRGLAENFISHTAMIHAFVQQFQKKHLEQGAIVVIGGAGIGSASSFANMTCYSTAKASLVHLVEALSEELLPLGLTINAVAPGAVRSGITDQAIAAGARAGAYAARAKDCKERGGVSPELAAESVEFLLTTRSLTGRLLSARFDMEQARRETLAISQDPNRYRLRRIDGELFTSKSG